jgi:hypothetical protein
VIVIPSRIGRRVIERAVFIGALILAVTVTIQARDLVRSGTNSSWKYLDIGAGAAPPSPGWIQAGFDDSNWKSGSAPLGYGEARLQTRIRNASDRSPKPITTWFRQEFDAPGLESAQRCVLLLCVDDGAAVYLNGRELARLNLPRERITAATKASREMSNDQEGFYFRLPVPDGLLRAQSNVVAVEVHQASVGNEDLFFDFQLKTLPEKLPAPELSSAAHEVVETFHRQHFLGPAVRVPDGFFDGGRHMAMEGSGRVMSGREILLVDRARDTELGKHLAFAGSAEMKSMEPLRRVQKLAAYIDRASTPPGGIRWVGQTIDQITHEFANQPLLIGDVLDQCQAGVCRHRALLFKILADTAGLPTALVRGNYAAKGTNGFPHAWNEISLPGGRRVLVDVMHNGGKAIFPEINNPAVVQHYLKEDNTPWYHTGP